MENDDILSTFPKVFCIFFYLLQNSVDILQKNALSSTFSQEVEIWFKLNVKKLKIELFLHLFTEKKELVRLTSCLLSDRRYC